jgi:hypothetical protein
MGEAAILAVVSDLHSNSTPGLCPKVFVRDDGGLYYPSPSQQWLLKCWHDFWGRVWRLKRQLGVPVHAVINGDLVDLNKHSQYQLISVNESDIINNGLSLLVPVLDTADRTYIVRGTEAHTGGVGWFEERIAREIGAVRDTAKGTASWDWLPLEICGRRFGFAHAPTSNSQLPWTKGGGANRTALALLYEYFGEEEWPETVVFGHVHHDEDSYDNHPIRTLFLPPWQLGTFYWSGRGRAYQRPKVGGNIFLVTEEEITLDKVRYKPKRRAFVRGETDGDSDGNDHRPGVRRDAGVPGPGEGEFTTHTAGGVYPQEVPAGHGNGRHQLVEEAQRAGAGRDTGHQIRLTGRVPGENLLVQGARWG